MIENTPEGSEAIVPGGNPRWIEYGVLGAVCTLVIGVYAYGARSGALESMIPSASDTHYNLLVQGFRAGQLNLKKEVPPGLAQLADPYDPSANAVYQFEPYWMLDMSYYKGRLYLYFGVTPAVILFWPYAALTGHYLFQRQAVAIFCAIGFLASVGLLRAAWRRYFAEVSVWVIAACVLALGLATGVPLLLSRSDVYEVPISCGYMLVMVALGAIWCALHETEPRKLSGWLVTASAAYGLAVGARPSLLFSAVILLVPVARAWRERRHRKLSGLTAATGPIILIGLGLMLYNALRFNNPLEFGMRYQLAPDRMDTGAASFSLRYLWYHFRVYFLEPARWTSHFPFVHEIAMPLWLGGHQGSVDRSFGIVTSIPEDMPFGILTNIPLVWLALAVPLAWRGRSPRLSGSGSNLRGFLVAVGLFSGICALTICLFRGGNMRYEVDFLPALVLLAVVGILGLERALAPKAFGGRQVWRRVVRWGWGLLLVFSVAFNLLVGVVNYAGAQNYMGNALLRAGKFQEAMAHYELALRVKPELDEAHNNWGAALMRAGKLEDAIRHLDQALRINPRCVDAHYNLGIAFEQLGRVQDAIRQFEQVLQIQPEDAEAHNKLGLVLERTGKLADAIGHYERALRIHPDYAEAHNDLGTALAGSGKVTEAVAHFEQALRIKPDFAEAHFNLGVTLEQAGRVQEAVGHYQQALRFKPDLAGAKDRLATLGVRPERMPVVQ